MNSTRNSYYLATFIGCRHSPFENLNGEETNQLALLRAVYIYASRRCPDGTSLTQKLKLFRRGKKLFFSLIYE